MTPKKAFFGMLGLLAVIIIASGVVFYLNDKQLESVATELEQLRSEEQIMELKVAAIEESSARIDELREIQNEIPKILPPAKVQSNLLANLIEIARQNGMVFTTINFPPTSDTSNFDISQTSPLEGVNGIVFTEATLETSVRGFDNLIKFLEDVEENQRLMQVNNISISPSGDVPGEESSFTISLAIEIFVRPS